MLTVMQKQALWVCVECWRNSKMVPSSREICFHWIAPAYQMQFEEPLHQTVLNQLAQEGYLKTGDLNRGGGRRYYTIPNMDRCEEALRDLELAPMV